MRKARGFSLRFELTLRPSALIAPLSLNVSLGACALCPLPEPLASGKGPMKG